MLIISIAISLKKNGKHFCKAFTMKNFFYKNKIETTYNAILEVD